MFAWVAKDKIGTKTRHAPDLLNAFDRDSKQLRKYTNKVISNSDRG